MQERERVANPRVASRGADHWICSTKLKTQGPATRVEWFRLSYNNIVHRPYQKKAEQAQLMADT
jgi:hypothetical protein